MLNELYHPAEEPTGAEGHTSPGFHEWLTTLKARAGPATKLVETEASENTSE